MLDVRLDAAGRVPSDWPHVVHAVYQVSCNLIHGGRSFPTRENQTVADLAGLILWPMWLPEVPEQLPSIGDGEA